MSTRSGNAPASTIALRPVVSLVSACSVVAAFPRPLSTTALDSAPSHESRVSIDTAGIVGRHRIGTTWKGVTVNHSFTQWTMLVDTASSNHARIISQVLHNACASLGTAPARAVGLTTVPRSLLTDCTIPGPGTVERRTKPSPQLTFPRNNHSDRPAGSSRAPTEAATVRVIALASPDGCLSRRPLARAFLSRS